MAIVVLVVVAGLILGVVIELVLSNRQRARKAGRPIVDSGTVNPLPPGPAEPRFIVDGEGFRIIGPVEYDDPGAAPWERGDPSAPEERA